MHRIADFIDQLLGKRGHADSALGAGRFGDRQLPGFAEFRDGIAHVGQRQFFRPVRKHPARGLGTAFDEMPRHRGRRQPVPIVPGPPEFPHRRSHAQRSIGTAAGDDDAGLLPECFDNSRRPQIGVGTDHVFRPLAQRFAGFDMRKLFAAGGQFLKPGEQIIAGDDADADIGQSVFVQGSGRFLCAQLGMFIPPALVTILSRACE